MGEEKKVRSCYSTHFPLSPSSSSFFFFFFFGAPQGGGRGGCVCVCVCVCVSLTNRSAKMRSVGCNNVGRDDNKKRIKGKILFEVLGMASNLFF